MSIPGYDAWRLASPPEPTYDCECDLDHDDCDGDECDCKGHDDGCSICGVEHGCICDDLYEAWKDRRDEDERTEPDFDYDPRDSAEA